MVNIFQEIDLTNFVTLNIKILHFLGYFFPQFENNAIHKVSYFIYVTVFVGIAFAVNIFTQIAFMIVSLDDIEKITEASFLPLTNIVQGIKMYCFMSNGPKIWKLVNTMNTKIFKPKNDHQCNIILDKIKMAKINTCLILLGCTLTCISWTISPLLDKKDGENIRLPLSGWYPFSTDKSPIFETIYSYQMLATWICGLGDLTMDTFISGTIMFTSAQLSLLNNSLETMLKNLNTSQENQKLSNQNLITNVEHYKSIIKFSKEVTTLFSAGITGQFVVVAIVVCISMFQMSLVSVFSFRFCAMLLYQVCVLMEIYLACFYGNEIIEESNRLTQSACLCDWTDASNEFKKNLIIFLSRTQFPLKLYAAGYFTLSLDTFKSIAKSSWSYFAVLNRVHNDKMK